MTEKRRRRPVAPAGKAAAGGARASKPARTAPKPAPPKRAPKPAPDPGPKPAPDPAAGAPIAAGGEDANDAGPSSADYSLAFTPRQVAVGLAIVAGLVAIAVSRRRKRTPTDD